MGQGQSAQYGTSERRQSSSPPSNQSISQPSSQSPPSRQASSNPAPPSRSVSQPFDDDDPWATPAETRQPPASPQPRNGVDRRSEAGGNSGSFGAGSRGEFSGGFPRRDPLTGNNGQPDDYDPYSGSPRRSSNPSDRPAPAPQQGSHSPYNNTPDESKPYDNKGYGGKYGDSYDDGDDDWDDDEWF
ncbi:MAG: hypothetical protein AAGA67_00335 [Cyanobacteria bacterium P01_F01_bin.153]